MGLGLALPAKRLVTNLAPADLPEEGDHFDLPQRPGPADPDGGAAAGRLEGRSAIGELNLNGEIAPVSDAVPPGGEGGAVCVADGRERVQTSQISRAV